MMSKRHVLQWAMAVVVTAGIVAALWLNYEPYDNAVPLDKSFQETIQRQLPGVGFAESPLKFSEYLKNLTEEAGSNMELHSATTPELFMGVLKKERAVVAVFVEEVENPVRDAVFEIGDAVFAKRTYAARMEKDRSYVTYTENYPPSSSYMHVKSLSHELVIFHYDNKKFVWMWTGVMIFVGFIVGLFMYLDGWKPRAKANVPPQKTGQG